MKEQREIKLDVEKLRDRLFNEIYSNTELGSGEIWEILHEVFKRNGLDK